MEQLRGKEQGWQSVAWLLSGYLAEWLPSDYRSSTTPSVILTLPEAIHDDLVVVGLRRAQLDARLEVAARHSIQPVIGARLGSRSSVIASHVSSFTAI